VLDLGGCRCRRGGRRRGGEVATHYRKEGWGGKTHLEEKERPPLFLFSVAKKKKKKKGKKLALASVSLTGPSSVGKRKATQKVRGRANRLRSRLEGLREKKGK